MNDSNAIRRALVQKLESLRLAGVQSIPRPRVPISPPTTSIRPSSSNTQAQPAAQQPTPSVPTSTPIRPANVVVADAPASVTPAKQATATFSANALPADQRSAALKVLADEVSACQRCDELVASRSQTVFGVGNPNARLVFFGEAPGADEDRLGEPFVGKAGQLLTKIIEACTLKREDVYIMNVLRCRPPANRNPTPEETSNCRPFFERQFDIVRPEFVCCLGAIAATTLLDTQASVGRLRGKFHEWRGMQVMVTYHPAYLLRNADAKKHVWTDMKMLMGAMGVKL